MRAILKLDVFPLFLLLTASTVLLVPLSACGGGGDPPPFVPTGRVAFGPLESATVEIFEVKDDGTFPLLHTQTTSASANPKQVGWFDPNPIALDPDALYMFRASGGSAVDYDEDGVRDALPTPIEGPVHAIALGRHAQTGHLKLTVISEILFHRAAYMLVAGYSKAEVLGALDELALLMLKTDLTGDGKVDLADVATWTPTAHKAALRKDWMHFGDAREAIRVDEQGWLSWTARSLSDSSVGIYTYAEPVQDVHVVGDRAYVAIQDTGFGIVDISDPRHPDSLGAVTGLGDGEDLGVQGDFVYFARRDDDLMQIYDVSDPANPVARGSFAMGQPDGMLPDGDVLFALDRDARRVRILDISDPDAPSEISSIKTNNDPNQVVRRGDLLFVADTEYLTVIDISDLEAPTLRAELLSWDDDLIGVALQGDYAFCADGTAGLLVVDVSDLDALHVVAQVKSRAQCNRIWIDGTKLYMSATDAGVQVIDITDPLAPVHRGFCAVSEGALVTTTSGDFTYVASDGGGLRVIDRLEPEDVLFADLVDDLILGTVETGTGNMDLVADGNYVYLAKDDGVSIVDISDPRNPTLVRSDGIAGDSESITRQGNLLFVAAEGGGLQIVDVSDPLNPIYKPIFALSDEAQHVAVAGSYAYVADRYGAEFIVVDVSDPDDPVWVGDTQTPAGDSTRAVAVQGNWAFVGWGYTGLVSVDITDPENPVRADELMMHDVGSVDPDFAHAVVVRGNYAYVMAEEMHVVDISDPYDLQWVRTVEIDVPDVNIALDTDFGVIVGGLGGLLPLVMTDPADPWIFAQLPTLGDAQAAYFHNGLILVANRNEGLTILRAPFSTSLP